MDVFRGPGELPSLTGVSTREARGEGCSRGSQRPPSACGTNAFVCSIEVADFDATANTILGLGGIVALPKFAVPGTCWQGYFIDAEGNTFGIFQVDENAG